MNANETKCVEFKTKQKREDVVKIFFFSNYTSRKTQTKTWRCYLYLGTDIVSQLGWKMNDHIRILRSLDDNQTIQLHKRCQDEEEKSEHKLFKGFTLRKVKGSYSYSLSFVWDNQDEINDLADIHKSIHTIQHEIIKGKEEAYIKICYGDKK